MTELADLPAVRDQVFLRLGDVARTYLERNQHVRTLVLGVTQTRADSKSERAVLRLFGFPTFEPAWPHSCPREGDEEDPDDDDDGTSCSVCGNLPELELDDGVAIARALSAFCLVREDDEGDAERFEPLAMARLGPPPGRALEVVRLAEVVRPFHDLPWPGAPAPAVVCPGATERELLRAVYAQPADDAPRKVLIDLWLQQGDPRGTHGALCFAGSSSPDHVSQRLQLERAHGRSWLGRLHAVVGLASAEFARGPFASSVTFACDDDATLEEAALWEEWATVESLRVAQFGKVRFGRHMRGLREVFGLDEAGFASLQEDGFGVAPSVLGLSLEDGESLAVAWRRAPGLESVRRLVLENVDELSDLDGCAAAWKGLESVEIWFGADVYGDASWDDGRAGGLLQALLPRLPLTLSFTIGYRDGHRLRNGVVVSRPAGASGLTLATTHFGYPSERRVAEAQLEVLRQSKPKMRSWLQRLGFR